MRIVDEPSSPSHLGVSWETPTTATVTWALPSNSGTSPVSGYILEIREEDCHTPQEILVNGLQYTAKNLKKDKKYMFSVAARNYNDCNSEFAKLKHASSFNLCTLRLTSMYNTIIYK